MENIIYGVSVCVCVGGVSCELIDWSITFQSCSLLYVSLTVESLRVLEHTGIQQCKPVGSLADEDGDGDDDGSLCLYCSVWGSHSDLVLNFWKLSANILQVVHSYLADIVHLCPYTTDSAVWCV